MMEALTQSVAGAMHAMQWLTVTKLSSGLHVGQVDPSNLSIRVKELVLDPDPSLVNSCSRRRSDPLCRADRYRISTRPGKF